MFRKMRRGKQVLTDEMCIEVMARNTNGVMACMGDDDYPYAVPLSYVYSNGKVYFHSAKSGHKVDAILKHSKVSFTVIDEDTIVSQEYTTYFRSVIAFGKARVVEGEEWTNAFRALVEKYSGDVPKEIREKEISGCTTSLIIAIDIEHMTGKEAIELVKARHS
ncbi:pyridoxamine 5'-phosphate oxidase family protein [Fusibacter tunisiensis]|uniref:Nitroimidazol reductase NimA-like FMN-containing flavoprotein (Pyridoxamine 5'-phosphate oxidase superfamily) n=1 Tax=Fusibacter tunisiensis TaxID=1008308 RepID=A0ABS2MN47_9FIRM|nr:pyridoxamine 5'-phosphate oxidase family protein [Fusibacter tunisiensis]MBM7560810.1 nitroimidazol reductase NimA-like FMN-containing flavoprotein (pyridoxamine 5'-phosphate oxidase superfamily) [Fusibacter tunisiensis]